MLMVMMLMVMMMVMVTEEVMVFEVVCSALYFVFYIKYNAKRIYCTIIRCACSHKLYYNYLAYSFSAAELL